MRVMQNDDRAVVKSRRQPPPQRVRTLWFPIPDHHRPQYAALPSRFQRSRSCRIKQSVRGPEVRCRQPSRRGVYGLLCFKNAGGLRACAMQSQAAMGVTVIGDRLARTVQLAHE